MFGEEVFSSERIQSVRNVCSVSAVAAFGIATECNYDNRMLASMCLWATAACLLQATVSYKQAQL